MTKSLEQAKRLFAAGESMQVERFAAHFSDECLYKFANNSAAHTPQEIINSSEEFLKRVTSVEHNIVNHHESGGRLYLQMEISYTCANGAQHTLPCCDALEFDDDGKVKELRIFMDISPVYNEPLPSDQQDKTQASITHEDIRKKVAEMYAALKKEDWKLFETFFDEDVVYKVGANDPVVGPDNISKTLKYIYKILKLTTHNQRGLWKADDETVIIEMDANYVNRLTEKFVQVPCTDIYRFENGKIVEWRVYPDASQTGFTSWFNK